VPSKSTFIKAVENLDHVTAMSSVEIDNVTIKFESLCSRKKGRKRRGPCEKRKKLVANMLRNDSHVDEIHGKVSKLLQTVEGSDEDDFDTENIVAKAERLGGEIEKIASRRSLSEPPEFMNSASKMQKELIDGKREKINRTVGIVKEKVKATKKRAPEFEKEYAAVIKRSKRAFPGSNSQRASREDKERIEIDLRSVLESKTGVRDQLHALLSAARSWISDSRVWGEETNCIPDGDIDLTNLLRTALLNFHPDRIPKDLREGETVYRIECLRRELQLLEKRWEKEIGNTT